MLNEFTILIATEAMLFYTNLLDPHNQSNAGWVSVVIFLINLTINLSIVGYKTIRLIKLVMIKHYRRFQRRYKTKNVAP